MGRQIEATAGTHFELRAERRQAQPHHIVQHRADLVDAKRDSDLHVLGVGGRGCLLVWRVVRLSQALHQALRARTRICVKA